MVEQALDRQELSLFLLLDHADILAEFDQLLVELVLSILFLMLSKDQIDLIGDTHARVLFLIVFPVGNRIGWLPRDQSSHLALLIIKRLLFSDKLLKLIDQISFVCLLLICTLFKFSLESDFALNVRRDLLLVSIFLHFVGFGLSLQAFIQDALQFRFDLKVFKYGSH